MKHLLVTLCLILISTSCSPTPITGAGQYTPGAPLPTAPAQPTLSVADVSPIPLEWPTPEYPLRDGGTLPSGTEPISAGNLERLRELAIWGKGNIEDLRWSSDGLQIVVDTAQDFCVYDSATLKRTFAGPNIGTYPTKSAQVEDLDFQSGTFTLRIYENGNVVDTLPVEPAFRASFPHAKYLPASNMLVIDRETLTQLYDVESHAKIADINGVEYRFAETPGGGYSYSSDYYSAFDATADRSIVATARFDGQITLRSGPDYKDTRTLQAEGPVRFIAFSPDGTKLAAESNGIISIWDVGSGSITGSLPDLFLPSEFNQTRDHYGTDVGLKMTVFGDQVAYVNKDDVLLLNTLTGQQRQLINGSEGATLDLPKDGIYDHPAYQEIANLFLTADGTKVVTVYEQRAYVWNATTGEFIKSLKWESDSRFNVPVSAFSSPLNALLIGAQDKNLVRAYELEKGDQLASLKAWNTGSLQYGYDGTHSMTVSPDGKYVFTWSGLEGHADLWEIGTQKRILSLKIPASEYSKYQPGFYPVTLSPDNTKLILSYNVSQTHNATVYSIPDGKVLYEISDVYHTVFSPDGSLLVASKGESQISFYNAQTGEHLRKLTGESPNRYCFQVLYFNTDGTRLIAVSTNGTVSVWGVP